MVIFSSRSKFKILVKIKNRNLNKIKILISITLTIKLNSFIKIIFTIGVALFFAGLTQNLHSVRADTVVETISVGQGPIALEFNPENENMYVADYNSGSVSVIDSSNNTIGETIPVGQGPIALEFNPENENMYVANEKSGSVSVIETE